MTNQELLNNVVSATLVGLIGVFLPNRKPISAVSTLWRLLVGFAPLKGLSKMSLPNLSSLGAMFVKAFDFIQANPWLAAEVADDAKVGLAMLTGDVASLAPTIKQAIEDAKIPEPWKSILLTDLCIELIVKLITEHAMSIQAEAQKPAEVPVEAPEVAPALDPSLPVEQAPVS